MMEKGVKRFARFVVSISAPGNTLHDRTKTSRLTSELMSLAGVHTVAIDANQKLAAIDIDIDEGDFSEALALLREKGYRCGTPKVSTARDIRYLASEPDMKSPSAFSFRPRSTKQSMN
jgi:cytochrome c peroxidase